LLVDSDVLGLTGTGTLDFVFEAINIFLREPYGTETRSWIKTFIASANDRINKLHRIITITSAMDRKFQCRFIFEHVLTGRARVKHAPVWSIMPKVGINLHVNVPQNFEIDIICDAVLSFQIAMIINLKWKFRYSND
jgi:hypothetical protein